jgi:hypothetical protein
MENQHISSNNIKIPLVQALLTQNTKDAPNKVNLSSNLGVNHKAIDKPVADKIRYIDQN